MLFILDIKFIKLKYYLNFIIIIMESKKITLNIKLNEKNEFKVTISTDDKIVDLKKACV